MLGHPGFGWEQWIRPTPSVLTVGIGSLWLVFFIVTVAVAWVASIYIADISAFCPTSDK